MKVNEGILESLDQFGVRTGCMRKGSVKALVASCIERPRVSMLVCGTSKGLWVPHMRSHPKVAASTAARARPSAQILTDPYIRNSSSLQMGPSQSSNSAGNVFA